MAASAKYTVLPLDETASLLRAPRAVLACLLDECLEERSVLTGLRMPLDADDESVRRVLHALECPVRCPGCLYEAVADAAQSLMVVRGHLGGRSDNLTQPRSLLHLDRVDGELARDLLVVVVSDLLWEVLDQVSPTRDVQELEPAADRERRHVALERGVQERDLSGVPPCLRRVRFGMRLCPVVRRVDVDTT